MVGDARFNGGSPAALINVLRLPLYLRDLVFLGHIGDTSPLSGVSGGGALAILIYIAVLIVGGVVLMRRYRWVER